MAPVQSMSLIQILNLLDGKKPKKGESKEVFGEVVRQAELFARQILERGLEHLSPDARLLLLLFETRGQTLLSRAALRKMVSWEEKNLEAALDSLLKANYLRAHQKKNSLAYELLHDSASRRRSHYVMHPTGATKLD